MKDFMTPIDRTGWEFVENLYKDLKNEINFTPMTFPGSFPENVRAEAGSRELI